MTRAQFVCQKNLYQHGELLKVSSGIEPYKTLRSKTLSRDGTMRVLVLTQLYPPDMGGGSARAENVVKGLISRGHELIVVAPFPHFPTGDIPKKDRHRLLTIEKGQNPRIIRTWVPPLSSKRFGRRLILFISFCASSLFALPIVGHVDVIWVANPSVFPVFPALIYRALKRCPITQSIDDLWPEQIYELNMLKSRFVRVLAEFAAKFSYITSAAITPISQGYVDTIVKKYNISPRKIHVVPGGVDLSRFPLGKERSKVEKRRNGFRVLYLGALSIAYDFDQVLKAATLLPSKNGIMFTIQGGGELGPTLKSKVREMGLSNVSIKLGVVNRNEVPRLLSDADVLLLPLSGAAFIEKGISSKLYEYQAAGKPIICSSNGQSAKFVSKTSSGIVVKPNDSEGIAKAVLYLYNNRQIAEKMGKAGRLYVENNFSSEKIALMIEKVFDSVLT